MKASVFKIAFSLVFLILLYGCILFKHSEKSITRGKDSLLNLQNPWKMEISPKLLVFNNIEGNIRSGALDNSFNGSLKYVSDSLIVISVNSILNIEVFRIYITNDSLYLLDRTKREFETTSFRESVKKYSEFFTITSVGDLLLGNMISRFRSLNFMQLQKGKDFSKYGVIYKVDQEKPGNEAMVFYVLNNSNKRPIEFSLQSSDLKFHVLYSEYRSFEGSLFPGKVQIVIKNKEIDFLLNMDIHTLKRMGNSNTHIFIPDGYKRRI